MPLDLPGVALGTLAPSERGPQAKEDVYRWATVTSVAPLYIRLDGDNIPLPMVPESLVDLAALVLGSRVWCQLFGRRVIILGVQKGGNVPRGLVAFAAITVANTQTFNSVTLVDVTNVQCTFTADPTRIYRTTIFCNLLSTVAADRAVVYLRDGVTTLAAWAIIPGIVSQAVTFSGSILLTPSAGSHVFRMALARNPGTGNITISNSATSPITITVEDLGAIIPQG